MTDHFAAGGEGGSRCNALLTGRVDGKSTMVRANDVQGDPIKPVIEHPMSASCAAVGRSRP